MFDDNIFTEEEAQLNSDYCNIHGDPLDLFESDTGDLFININDIKRTGFAILKRDIFHSLKIDPDQITQEFEYFLLSEAKKYIIQNRAQSIDEERVLRTIENVKRKLLGKVTRNDGQQFQNQDKDWSISKNQPEVENQIDLRKRSDSRNEQESKYQYDSRQHNGDTDVLTYQKITKNEVQSNPNQSDDKKSEYRYSGKSQTEGQKADLQESISEPLKPKKLPNNFSAGGRFISAKREKREVAENVDDDSSSGSLRGSTTGIIKQKLPRSNSSISSEGKGVSYQKNEKINLEIGDVYEVKVCYQEPDKDNICWVHEKETLTELEEMMNDIWNIEPSLEPLTTFDKNDLVLGSYEGFWYRARVMQSDSKKLHFLDYGNKSTVNVVKPLPDKFKNFPAFAVRLVVNRDKVSLEDGSEFSIKINKKYNDGTYLVDAKEETLAKTCNPERVNRPSGQIEQKQAFHAHSPDRESVFSVVEEKPAKIAEKKPKIVEEIHIENTEPAYFNIPPPLATVEHGMSVLIADFRDEMFYLKTKECVDKEKVIKAHIKDLDKSEKILASVKEGQLVLCSKEGMVSLFRAIIEEKNGMVAKVRYVDYAGSDNLSVKSLRNIDEYLSKQPALMLPTPELSYLKGISLQHKNYVAELIQRKEKLTVLFSNNQMDFRQENGELLSTTLLEFKNSLRNQDETVPKQITTPLIHEEKKPGPSYKNIETNEKVLFDHMPYITVEPGINQFISLSVNGPSDLTFALKRDDVIGHIELLLDIVVAEDEDAYKPDINEMCLVYNDPDDQWYRATVYDINNDEFTVYMVDFGKEISVKSDKMRRLPKDLQKIPIIGIRCELADFPDTPEMTRKMKNVVKENEGLTANVLEYVDDTVKYMIEIPGLQEALDNAD